MIFVFTCESFALQKNNNCVIPKMKNIDISNNVGRIRGLVKLSLVARLEKNQRKSMRKIEF